eukprot:gene3496-6123_t
MRILGQYGLLTQVVECSSRIRDWSRAYSVPASLRSSSTCRLPYLLLVATPFSELVRRRQEIARRVAPRSVVIVAAAPTTYMTNDIPYRFRQAGLAKETPAAIILITDNQQQLNRTIIVTEKQNETDRIWNGARLSADDAAASCGQDVEGLYIDDLAREVGPHYTSHQLYINSTVQYDQKFLQQVLAHLPSTNRFSANALFDQIRLVKSLYEVEMMKTSAKIASIGFCNAMSSAYPGQNEQEIDAILESSFRLHGASMHAYPPVVAGGSNAITLHYISNNAAIGNAKSSVGSFQWSSCHHSREDFNCCKRISAGSKGTPYLIRGTNEHHNHVEHDLVLVDAGCEYGLYCSDITRCWPMSGQFTEEQSLVYEAVLTIQRKCIEALESKVVTSLHNLHQVFMVELEKAAFDLGLISPHATRTSILSKLKVLCPHSIGHYLGLDVHDARSISNINPLLPGMVITVEPGLYIPIHASFPSRLRGIGVRIEDDIVISENNIDVLSQECPKMISDIERAMSTKQPRL